ncbi:hypothetical protein H1P_2490009 [Hyella patelloides LEGE 07179]|uniref:PBP domain-containing protein n=1 Tax=Hyella patelloides LEGE 07179 TaxID=945734 RepID=A0A563VS10_9CYAN|nr:substrate-binding domain-containing protein [Hyella patelloides]VEP14205.1 hypothetical protein H1P_2490009 [Hyella patelloides LEGE 07179]
MLHNNNNNSSLNSHQSISSKEKYQVCNRCGYDTNEPNSVVCENCNQPLTSKKEQKAGNSLKIDGRESTTLNKNQRKKVARSNKMSYIFSIAGGIAILTTGVLAFTLNTSPKAAIKNATGRISFGGEPCSQRLVNQKIAKAIKNINSEVKFRYSDNDPNKDQIQELIEGQVQIAFSEKAYLDSHFKRAKERGIQITAIPYAYDGIAYVTDKKTETRPLTVKELEDIFQGKITNWKQLGGEDKKIVPILVAGLWQNPMGIKLVEQLNPNTVFMRDRSEAKEFLKKTNGAIFYTSATLAAVELNDLNVVSIKKDDGTIVSPVIKAGVTNQQDIDSGKYPLVRALNIIVNSEIFQNHQNYQTLQKKGVKALVEYLVSPEGQAIVEDAGFVPKYEAAKDIDSKFSFLPWF